MGSKEQTSGIAKAVLVAVTPSGTREELVTEHLDELAFLAETAGIRAIRRFIQHLAHPDVRSHVGKGKLEEIRNFAQWAVNHNYRQLAVA